MASEPNTPEDGLTFLESPSFSKRADQHLGEVGREALFVALLEDPEAGAVVADTDGARKIRVALPGRGKSGGARVIYYYRHTSGAIFFLALYPKNEKGDLTAEDKKELRKEVRKIKEEAYP